MIIGDKVVIHAYTSTWIGMAHGAYHWHGALCNTEGGPVENSPAGYPDKIDALKWATDEYFRRFDYDKTILMVSSSKVDRFR